MDAIVIMEADGVGDAIFGLIESTREEFQLVRFCSYHNFFQPLVK